MQKKTLYIFIARRRERYTYILKDNLRENLLHTIHEEILKGKKKYKQDFFPIQNGIKLRICYLL